MPIGTNHAEMNKAYAAAAAAYRQERGLSRDADLPDDALWFTSDGEEIVIYFECEKEEPLF